MSTEIRQAAQRAFIIKQTMELWRAASRAWFGEERFATRADDLFLCWSILVGQIEGRPMNASKLAEFSGLPRPTVLRKVRKLEAEGIVARAGGDFCIVPEFANSEPLTELARHMVRAVKDGGAKLSKMDT